MILRFRSRDFYFLAEPLGRLLEYCFDEEKATTSEIIRGCIQSLESLGKQLSCAIDGDDIAENPALLLAFEQLGFTSTMPVALYAGGRVSGRVLHWLAGISDSGFRLTHFPDYVLVSLKEFIRIHTRLADRSTLHLPVDLGEAFDRFANFDLLRRKASQALLPGLRASRLPEIRTVLALIERHNAGLEQEALLVVCEETGKPRKVRNSRQIR